VTRVFLGIAALSLAACAKRYRVEGLVIQVDQEKRTILVSHRPIEHYMPPLTMPFHVAAHEDLANLAPGTRLNFDLRVGKHESVARNLKPRITRLEGADGKEIPVAQPANKLGLGASVPDFTLTDQSGRLTRLSHFPTSARACPRTSPISPSASEDATSRFFPSPSTPPGTVPKS
jgi:Cu/Ag efflux protein CusF